MILVLKPIPVFDTVSPNKLFDALAAGLPVLQDHARLDSAAARRA